MPKEIIKENIAKLKNIIPLGLIFSAFLVLGNSISVNHTVEYRDIKIYFSMVGISIIIDIIILLIYNLIEKIENRAKKKRIKETKKLNKKRYIIIFLIIVICWTPIFLGAYPGYFCYDATSQYSQYTKNYITAWHPVIHTLILGSAITFLNNVFGNMNTAIAIYIFVQMLIIAACFTYTIYFLEKYQVSRVIKYISIAFYALFPVIAMFATCSTKDNIFTALTLLSIVVSLEALMDKEKFFNSKLLQVRFIVIIFLAMIFRTNAIYAFIPFLVIFVLRMKDSAIFAHIGIIMALYMIYTGPIYWMVGVPGRYVKQTEAFSVPLQQIARVYNYDYESLEDEEIEKIHKFISDEQIRNYRPKVADDVKAFITFDNIGFLNFVKLWFEIGIKHPGMYIDSFLENTYGFWYPKTLIDGYDERDGYTTETSYFEATCEAPGIQDSKIPYIRNLYLIIARTSFIQNTKVVWVFFSIGAYFWLFLTTFWYNMYKKRKNICTVLALIMFLWLTVQLGPMVLVRYVLILFYALPVILTLLFNGYKFERNEKLLEEHKEDKNIK